MHTPTPSAGSHTGPCRQQRPVGWGRHCAPQLLQAHGLGHLARISREHAIHVRPDGDVARLQGGRRQVDGLVLFLGATASGERETVGKGEREVHPSSW